jgi:hypothetical protein
MGGPQGDPGQVQKISPPPETYPPISEPVASRSTNYAVPANWPMLFSSDTELLKAYSEETSIPISVVATFAG